HRRDPGLPRARAEAGQQLLQRPGRAVHRGAAAANAGGEASDRRHRAAAVLAVARGKRGPRLAELTLPGASHRPLRFPELKTLLFTGVLVTTLFLVLLPVLLLIFYSFSVGTPSGPLKLGLDAWRRMAAEPVILTSLWHTIQLLVAVHAISFPVAIVISW